MSINVRLLIMLIAVAATVRIVLSFIVPFADTTESRYADIARMMLETNDWITPWYAPGEPFWGKPPLSFWSQALAFKLFGLNEIAGRLPSLLMSVLTAWLVYIGTVLLGTVVSNSGSAQKKSAPELHEQGLVAVLIYCTMSLPFISAGTVMTDTYFVFATTLTLVSLFAVLLGQKKRWQWSFFAGIGLGLLAKGPLVLVLCGIPIFFWLLLTRQWVLLWRSLPWSKGILLSMLIAAPWYVLAEIKTPGFINYFLIGEHVSRFLVSDWPGDRYGDAHDITRGTIWLYLLLASFPWGIAAAALLCWRRLMGGKHSWPAVFDEHRLFWLMLFAAFTPVLFFTLSSNILWTYVLPGLPFMAMICAWLLLYTPANGMMRVIVSVSLIIPVMALVAGTVIASNQTLLGTEKYVLEQIYADRDGSAEVVYVDTLPFSARFYSAGRARKLPVEVLADYLQRCPNSYLAIKKKQTERISQVQLIYPEYAASQDYLIYRLNGC